MISVLIIGNGNVAFHLFEALKNKTKLNVLKISSRNVTVIPNADITILCVSDDAIAEVSSKITNSLVVHTSGSVSIDGLKNSTRKGVFYMLQTFSKEKPVNFQEVPFCLEANQESDVKILTELAKTLSTKLYYINSVQRKSLHLAAVFANNFSNHCCQIANEICNKNHIPFQILHPLIQETARKIILLSPKEAQTGPAIRNDQKTIKNHLSMLAENQQEIYSLLTKSIQNGH